MSSRIITKTLICGHCDHCRITFFGIAKEYYCRLYHKRVSPVDPFCDDWTPMGFDVSLLLPDNTSGKNLPIFVMVQSRG